MRIWVDLSNSPHPLLFAPIARRLGDSGHTILVTARDNAQTVELARERWPALDVIGGPSPKGRVAKVAAMVRRVDELCRWARAMQPDIALSHNSYGQIVAARAVGIPAVTAMDYEHQPANHLAFRLARTVLLPAALAGSEVRRQGATARKTRFYSGLKEEIYLTDFEPDPELPSRLGIDLDAGQTLVVARPEPARAIYHSFENPLFHDCLKAILRDPSTRVVVLPRHPEQRRALEELRLERCFVPDRAVETRSLLSRADLMIGAGGTMTREAALMGVPTLSLFAGRRPAVDEWLESRGMMRMLRSVDELPAVEPQAHADRLQRLRERGGRIVQEFCAGVTDGQAA